MTRGMPGWEFWKPMLLKFGLPPAIGGIILSICVGFDPAHLVFILSGVFIAATYVMGTKWEAEGSKFFEKINMTAEHLGRISYGVMALGLAML